MRAPVVYCFAFRDDDDASGFGRIHWLACARSQASTASAARLTSPREPASENLALARVRPTLKSGAVATAPMLAVRAGAVSRFERSYPAVP